MRRIIRHPANKRNLAPLPLARSLILDIEDGIAPANPLDAGLVLALGVEELLAEFAVVRVGAGFFHDDLFPVVADFVDDPFGAFAEFQLVEGLDAFGGDGDSAHMLLVGVGGWVGGGEDGYPDCAWEVCVSGEVLLLLYRVVAYHDGPPVRVLKMLSLSTRRLSTISRQYNFSSEQFSPQLMPMLSVTQQRSGGLLL